MRQGRLVAQGTLAEVRSGSRATAEVRTPTPERAAAVLVALGLGDVQVTDWGVQADPGDLEPERIVAALVRDEVGVRGFAIRTPSLEDLFVSLTGEGFDVSS
jgi:ABC-2 type transport system ATP-binding protein